MYEEKINAYFDAPERRAELVEAISRLVRIRSVIQSPPIRTRAIRSCCVRLSI